MLCVSVTVSGKEELTTWYYAGKDEICLTSPVKSAVLKISQVSEVTDFYPAGDRETHCIITASVNADHRVNATVKFTASASKCALVLETAAGGAIRVTYAADHICSVASIK